MKKRAKQKKHISKSGILISCIYGLLGAVIILLLLIAIFSAIGLANENPHSLLTPISFFSIYAAAFLGGFISVKKNKGSDSLLCGIISGIFITLFYSFIFWILSVIFKVESTAMSWLFRALIILFSSVGALIGVSRAKKMPKKKKRK